MTTDDIWANLGTFHNEVKILPYNRAWPEIFQQEKIRISKACPSLKGIEHIGSTSIKNLDAKPIIDIMLGHQSKNPMEEFVGPMQSLGYDYLGEYGIPERLFFVLKHNGHNIIHCHMFAYDNWQWKRHVFFRDYLRQHHDVAQEYLELKLRLAQQYRHDRQAYSAHKTDFVARIEKHYSES